MADAKNFDLVGTLINEKGLTGENLSLKIFSYLDISSRLRVRMVSKTWYRFLTRQIKMWMAEVRKIVSLLEYIDKSSPTNPL